MRTVITTTPSYLRHLLDFAAYLTVGRRAIDGWTDETQPRTDRPLFFIPSELYQRTRRSSKAPERSHLSEHPRRASIALASTTN